MKNIFFVVFFALCKLSKNADTVTCDSRQKIFVPENEIVFFESPNFPEPFTEELKRQCFLEFYGNSTKVSLLL